MKLDWFLNGREFIGLSKITTKKDRVFAIYFMNKSKNPMDRKYQYNGITTGMHEMAVRNQDLKCTAPNEDSGNGYTGGQDNANELNILVNDPQLLKSILKEIFDESSV